MFHFSYVLVYVLPVKYNNTLIFSLHVVPLIGIHHLIVFLRRTESLSRNHSWNACRFFFYCLARRSRVFTIHNVSRKLICLAIEASGCAPNESWKIKERPGFDPSTLGAVRLITWRISPPDQGAPQADDWLPAWNQPALSQDLLCIDWSSSLLVLYLDLYPDLYRDFPLFECGGSTIGRHSCKFLHLNSSGTINV